MKRKETLIVVVLGVVVAALVVFVYYYTESTGRISYGDITVEQAKKLIETKPSLVILDVRTVWEFEDGHIEGAINIPVEELQQRLGELNLSDEILVYCRTGNRSRRAVQILADNGFSSVYHMLGGIEAWKQAGCPTVK